MQHPSIFLNTIIIIQAITTILYVLYNVIVFGMYLCFLKLVFRHSHFGSTLLALFANCVPMQKHNLKKLDVLCANKSAFLMLIIIIITAIVTEQLNVLLSLTSILNFYSQ